MEEIGTLAQVKTTSKKRLRLVALFSRARSSDCDKQDTGQHTACQILHTVAGHETLTSYIASGFRSAS